jgi:hypothetical protein
VSKDNIIHLIQPGNVDDHPQQPVTCAQISARKASLCPAPSRGMLLLKEGRWCGFGVQAVFSRA